jgi:hypothetical protein
MRAGTKRVVDRLYSTCYIKLMMQGKAFYGIQHQTLDGRRMLAARRRGGQCCDEIGDGRAHHPSGETNSAVGRDERIATELTADSLDR